MQKTKAKLQIKILLYFIPGSPFVSSQRGFQCNAHAKALKRLQVAEKRSVAGCSWHFGATKEIPTPKNFLSLLNWLLQELASCGKDQLMR